MTANLKTTNLPTNSTHIVPTINHEASGPSYSVTRLCRALRAAGHPIKLAVLEPLPKGMEHGFVTAFPYGVGPKKLGVSPKMKRWLREEAQSGRSQILHNHSLWMVTNLYPAAAIRRTSCKLVVSPRGTLSAQALVHSAAVKKIAALLLLWPAMHGVSAFHATSEQEYRDIRGKGFRQPVAILPNGIDVPEYSMENSKPQRQLLFLGRIHPIKGIDNLLHAWAAVQGRFADWQLVIAGPDNDGYLMEMKNLAEKLGLKRCDFPGPIYGDEKHLAYAQAALYVLPTHSENFGMTVAEALAAGTPAMVTKGAPWEGLEREGAGWWIDIGVDPLIAALEESLALPPESLAKKGRHGREWMIRDFSWEQIGTDMGVFYDWLINGGEVPPFVRVD